MSLRNRVLVLSLAAMLSASAAEALPDKGRDLTGNVYGGWAAPQGDAGDIAKDGWLLGGGVAYQPRNWVVGLTFGIEYGEFDLERRVVDLFEGTGGDVTIWGVPVGVTWSPDTEGGFGFYLSGGAGMYRVEGRIFDIGIVEYPPVCDPWLWWCIPGGIGIGEGVRDSESTTRPGVFAAAGLSFETGGLSEIYVEIRWQQINTKERTEIIPVLVGFRW
jgi:hypothetical protein